MCTITSGRLAATARATDSASRTSPSMFSMPSPTRARSCSDGCVGGPEENPVTRAPAHRALLPDGVRAVDVAPDVGRQHEEAAVGPAAVAARLLLELAHARALDVERAEATRRLHGGDRRAGPLFAMEGHERRDVDVGEAVAVGEAEVLVAHVRQH